MDRRKREEGRKEGRKGDSVSRYLSYTIKPTLLVLLNELALLTRSKLTSFPEKGSVTHILLFGDTFTPAGCSLCLLIKMQ